MSEMSLSKAGLSPPPANQHENLLTSLGPGVITGAADDDPSGIATYSQVGAQFGMGMLWTMLFSFPLMAAIQEICARLGRITGAGIAENLRKHYPRPLLLAIVILLTAANIFNLGADVSAMAAATTGARRQRQRLRAIYSESSPWSCKFTCPITGTFTI